MKEQQMWRRMRRSVRTMGADQRGGLLEAVIGYGMVVAAITSAATALPQLAKTVSSILAHDRAFAVVANSTDHFVHDCRSARACDVPAVDVAGVDNSDGHAWAALFQASDGTYKVVEYVHDRAAHTLQAYVGPPDALAPYGPPLSNVQYFHAQEFAASDVADSSSAVYLPIITVAPQNVDVKTQFAGFVGGNHLVEIRVANEGGDLTVDVMPGGAADTGLTTISGTYTPPPPSSCSFVSSYAGSSSTGWTPQTSTSLWQWYQTPAPCTPAPTPPPVAYVADYAPNCDTTFYRAENGSADWTQQPRADATTPPPTHALTGYDANGAAVYQDFAWNQGPCPHPTPPAQDPNATPTPAPTPTPPARPARLIEAQAWAVYLGPQGAAVQTDGDLFLLYDDGSIATGPPAQGTTWICATQQDVAPPGAGPGTWGGFYLDPNPQGGGSALGLRYFQMWQEANDTGGDGYLAATSDRICP